MASHPKASVVLGGGGVTGIAWLIGVVAGLTRQGFVFPAACEFVGTSAGSVVSAELAHGVSPEDLLEKQLQAEGSNEAFQLYSQREADARNQVLVRKVNGDLVQARKRIGAFALRSETPSLEMRRSIIRSRLSSEAWPTCPLRLIAVDTATAQSVVLDKSGQLNLVDAVMASCAVPGVWPPVPLDDARLMDGGLRSMTNADLATESSHVLVLAPLGYSEDNPVSGHLRKEVEQLRQSGANVDVIVPDEDSVQAIGDNVLDPGRRIISAQAGLKQGLSLLQSLHAPWRER